MKTWLSYGLKGVAIGILLLLFYLGVYYPLIQEYAAVDGMVANSYELLPMMTGHGEIFFLAFAFHDLPWSICPKTEEQCFSWAARETVPDTEPCIPWILDDPESGKQSGCCVGKDMTASEVCTAPLEAIIGLFFLAVLLGLYFSLGVLYWWVRWERKISGRKN